jgi:hypothetical protein
MTMLSKLNLKRTKGLVAALAIASLSGPAWAQDPPRYFSPECAQYFKDVYCPAHWQADHFASQSACADYYRDEVCWYTYWVRLDLPATVRNG